MSKFNVKKFYDLLGVPEGAAIDVIKKAYRKFSIQQHPDKVKQAAIQAKLLPEEIAARVTEANEKFKAVSEAYECLSDPEKMEKARANAEDAERREENYKRWEAEKHASSPEMKQQAEEKARREAEEAKQKAEEEKARKEEEERVKKAEEEAKKQEEIEKLKQAIDSAFASAANEKFKQFMTEHDANEFIAELKELSKSIIQKARFNAIKTLDDVSKRTEYYNETVQSFKSKLKETLESLQQSKKEKEKSDVPEDAHGVSGDENYFNKFTEKKGEVTVVKEAVVAFAKEHDLKPFLDSTNKTLTFISNENPRKQFTVKENSISTKSSDYDSFDKLAEIAIASANDGFETHDYKVKSSNGTSVVTLCNLIANKLFKKGDLGSTINGVRVGDIIKNSRAEEEVVCEVLQARRVS